MAVLVLLLLPAPAIAQDRPSNLQASPQVAEFLRLLQDPGVQAWLLRGTVTAPSEQILEADATIQSSPAHFLDERLAKVHQHLTALAVAAPSLPTQLGWAADALVSDVEHTGGGHALLLVSLFVALGLALEWATRRAFGRAVYQFTRAPVTTAGQLARAASGRLIYEMGLVFAFVAGSACALLVSDWPPLLREAVVSYLLALTILRVARAVARFILSPDDGRLTLLPVQERAARFWYAHIGFLVGWLAFGWVTVELLGSLGLSDPSRQLIGYALGIGLVIAGCLMIWRRPADALLNGDTAVRGDGAQVSRRGVTSFLLSGYVVLLWSLWVAGTMGLFWFAVIVWALPTAIGLCRQATEHILGASKDPGAAVEQPTVVLLLLERGLRAGLIVAAAFGLAYAWHLDIAALMATDTIANRLIRGVVGAAIIVLVADLVWRIVRGLIDDRLAASPQQVNQNPEQDRRRSRMRTLLPILRNVAFVVVITIAALMVLAAMGVKIAPLIAGAGVIGVAVGFGAQTLVKDIISGMFYLLDDAFRVGEYIQSGNYKGTVESFSLRSVKLRHHRGPLYTVPFGELGAVENMSRDWVIDKMTIGVTYDTDLDKAKKLIKQVGKQLADDPEYKPNIIEPLKMQGVEQFGDFAIQLRMKMICKPGEQFVIRRKAFALVKQSFDANGIKFASPTVRVAHGDAPDAAAQQGVRTAKLVAGIGST